MTIRELKPCGTRAAYRRHRRNGEQACAACREAEAETQRRLYGHVRREPPKCGTPGGYKKHRQNAEVACSLCLAAWAEYMAAWRKNRAAA